MGNVSIPFTKVKVAKQAKTGARNFLFDCSFRRKMKE
jgi:hypothetical protein